MYYQYISERKKPRVFSNKIQHPSKFVIYVTMLCFINGEVY